MIKKKSFLMILAIVLILPFAFMLYGCFGNNNNNNNNEPLPEGYYRITVQQTTGGSVNASKNSAQEGEEITLSYTTNNGYLFVRLTIKDGNNQDVELNDNKFTMPASDVTVSATFERISNQKFNLVIEPSEYYEIELISPDERQFGENEGKIQAGTRVVLRCDVWSDFHNFKSWNVVDVNGNKVIVDSNNSFIMPNSNVTVSVVVEEITYTVSIDPETAKVFNVTIRNEDDDNNIVEDGGSVKFNDRITFSYEFKGLGYTLRYWVNQNGERIYETGTLVQSNLVISALFTINKYTVRMYDRLSEDGEYNSYGVTAFYFTNKDGQRLDQIQNSDDRNKAETGEEITVYCEPRNKNFVIEYYILRYYDYENYEYCEEILTTNKFNMLPYNITISVKLNLVENTYNVNYVLDGGTVPQDATTTFKSTDDTLVIPNPTKDGYRFMFWEGSEHMDFEYLNNTMLLNPKVFGEDLTLTARWEKCIKLNYVFGEIDGLKGYYVTNPNPSDYALSDGVKTLEMPIHKYGKFSGWYTSDTFEEEYKITTLYYPNIEEIDEITLYANMTLKNFHINFIKIGVSTDGTTKVLENSAYLDWFNLEEESRDLTRDMYNEKTDTLGYTFKGFYTNRELTDPIYEVSNELDQDITIYAKETLDTYTITYYANYNGTYGPVTEQYAASTYTVETEEFMLPNASDYNNVYGTWRFVGWRLNNKDSGESFERFTRIHPNQEPEKYHGNLTFYAYYELQQ